MEKNVDNKTAINMFITLVIMLGDSVLSLFSVFPVHVQLIQDLERLEETNAPHVSELCLAHQCSQVSAAPGHFLTTGH